MRAAGGVGRLDLVDALLRIDYTETPEGQQKVLINQLYEFPLNVMEELLLQVVHLSVTHSRREHHVLLKRFLLHLAAKSMNIAIRLSWIIDAITPTFVQLGLQDRVQDLRDSIETVAIQGGRRTIGGGLPSEAQSAILDYEVQRMQKRLALFNDERLFTMQLTSISNQLRQVADRSRRKGELHRMLNELNEKFLVAKRVVFPLGTSAKAVDWIVQIVVDECSVFSSRERAPYSLICEVIRDEGVTYTDPTTTSLFEADGTLSIPESSATSSKHYHHHRPSAHARTKSQEGQWGGDLLTEVFGETPSQRKHRLRSTSVYGNHPRWDVASVIIKAGDDLRQEELALQVIDVFNKIWQEAGLTCMVVPYAAVSTTSDAGVIEMLTDSSSIDSIKKKANVQSLHQFFVRAYGGEGTKSYALAQSNFIETMAGYSVVSFLVQIKDRHNGNLMLTRSGHLVHIDFGFMLATSPGGIKFESAPFKLSQELVDVMGGPNSTTFQYFKVLFFQGLKVAREHAEEIVALVELMTPYNTIACFGPDPNAVVQQMRDRLRFDLETDVEFAVYVKELISISLDNWRTKKYDQFQTLQNGII